MNNAFLTSEAISLSDAPQKEAIDEREAKLVRTISAIKKLVESDEWSSLKTEVFDGLVEQYKKAIFHEARNENPNVVKLAKLNGQYEVAKRYHDLAEFGKTLQTELNSLRLKYGKTTQKPEA